MSSLDPAYAAPPDPTVEGTEQERIDITQGIDTENTVQEQQAESKGWLDCLKSTYFILVLAAFGWALAITFLVLYITKTVTTTGGQFVPVPVVLQIAVKNYTENEFFKRMYIGGFEDKDGKQKAADVQWKNQSDFWYLNVASIQATGKDCPVSRNGTFGAFDKVSEFNKLNTSSCNLYDFRLVIFNNLTNEFKYGATIHFHGLTPPSNLDGVPFVSNANIHPQNLQSYRFTQYTYPGVHWMHAHTGAKNCKHFFSFTIVYVSYKPNSFFLSCRVGFQQAYGVAAPIVLQHNDLYFENNDFDKKDDLVVMLEEGFVYPKCAYSTDWYETECSEIRKARNISNFAILGLYINRRETPLVHTPDTDVKQMRIRFLNGGSEAPWRITNKFAKKNNGTKVPMEIMATDGNDVARGVVRDEFVLGLANRIDVLLNLKDVEDNTKDILITAVQMKHSNDVRDPALRHIVIRGQNTPAGEEIIVDALNSTAKNQTSPILKDFNLFANLTALHPLAEREITRSFTVENRGGDQFGGFPLTIYEGLVKNGSNPSISNLTNLYPTNTYTALNQLKFQLPPYKVYRHNVTKEVISTRRKCENCAQGNYNGSGIFTRPTSSPYVINYTVESNRELEGRDDTCCWEWCDVPEEDCQFYKLEDVNRYEPNKNYITVCFGDRVRILFINTASFEGKEGHPMHLHGHDFVLRELYRVQFNGDTMSNYSLVLDDTYEYDISGPKVDSVWVPFNQAVAFEFDAYNAGEHLFHCHNDFHLENGMMTTVRYMHDEYCSDLPEFVGGVSDFPKQICTMDDCMNPGQEF